MHRTIALMITLAALLVADATLEVSVSSAEAQVSARQQRARRARAERRARARAEARAAREADEEAASADEEGDEADPEASADAATPAGAPDADEPAPSLSESQPRRLDFEARVIRGETAGRGAIVLFERGGRTFEPLARVRKRFLDSTILAVFGEEPARPAEASDDRHD